MLAEPPPDVQAALEQSAPASCPPALTVTRPPVVPVPLRKPLAPTRNARHRHLAADEVVVDELAVVDRGRARRKGLRPTA